MKTFISVLLFFFINHLYGQEALLNQKTIDTTIFDIQGCDYLDRIKETLLKDTTKVGWSKYYTLKSYCYLRAAQNDSAYVYVIKGTDSYESSDNGYAPIDRMIHKAYYIKGLREYFDGKILTSLSTLNKALEYSKKYPKIENEISWKRYIYSRIQVIHSQRGDYSLALKAALEEKKDKKIIHERYEGSLTYEGLGSLHKYLGNIDSAQYYYRKSYKKITDTTLPIAAHYPISSFHLNVVGALNNLGDMAEINNKKDSALYYYKKSFRYLKENNVEYTDRPTLIAYSTKANYGNILIENKKYREALNILNHVKDSISKKKKYNREERDLQLKVHKHLKNAYAKTGEFKKALQTNEELINYLITYNENSISRQLQLYTVEYDVEEKDTSIKNLTETTKLQDLEIRQRSIIIGGGIILFIILSILSYIILKKRRTEQKYEMVHMEQRLLRSQLNPHFLFNALNSIVSLSSKNPKKTTQYTLKLSSLLRSILNNSREEFVSISNELESLKDYLELESDFSKKFKYSINFSESIDPEEVLIPPMFIQPFIENSIKHGFVGNDDEMIKVFIDLDTTKKRLYCSIKDTGISYSQGLENKFNSNHNSVSGKILRERLELYSKVFKTKVYYNIKDGENNKGTVVDLYLPFLIDE